MSLFKSQTHPAEPQVAGLRAEWPVPALRLATPLSHSTALRRAPPPRPSLSHTVPVPVCARIDRSAIVPRWAGGVVAGPAGPTGPAGGGRGASRSGLCTFIFFSIFFVVNIDKKEKICCALRDRQRTRRAREVRPLWPPSVRMCRDPSSWRERAGRRAKYAIAP